FHSWALPSGSYHPFLGSGPFGLRDWNRSDSFAWPVGAALGASFRSLQVSFRRRVAAPRASLPPIPFLPPVSALPGFLRPGFVRPLFARRVSARRPSFLVVGLLPAWLDFALAASDLVPPASSPFPSELGPSFLRDRGPQPVPRWLRTWTCC